MSDGRMLRLIKLWLKAPIEERTPTGKRQRTSAGSRGTPQGGVRSPPLANIYMRRFLMAWDVLGHGRKLKARIVNYADDFVILCRGTAEKALAEAKRILTRIGLTLNEKKTRICKAWETPFDFLGYTFGRCYTARTGKPYLGAKPSQKRLARLREGIRELTEPHTGFLSEEELIGRVNCVLRGWAQYFSYGTLSKAYRAVDAHVLTRVRHWLRRKQKRRCRSTRQCSGTGWAREHGLLLLSRSLARFRMPSV